MREGRLGYNSYNKRYGLLSSDLWIDTGFHCGECLEVLVDDQWVKTRMEMNPRENGIWLGHRIVEIWSMCGQGYRNKADRKSNSRFVVSEKISPDMGRKRGRIRPK